jgi:hypothetical protein
MANGATVTDVFGRKKVWTGSCSEVNFISWSYHFDVE